MSQKSSVPQAAEFVSQALKQDNRMKVLILNSRPTKATGYQICP